MDISVWLGILLLVVDLGLFPLSLQCGILLLCFMLVYFAIIISMRINLKPMIMNELVSFATEYGQIQKRLLRELELPYALLDDSGKIIWTNQAFEELVDKEKGYNKSITSLFPNITKDKLPYEESIQTLELQFEHFNYKAVLKRISLNEMAKNSDIIDSQDGYDGYLIAMYLFDETALKLALQEVDDESLSVGLIYIDNYEEALESVEDVRRSLLVALIDRKINKYVAGYDGICKKIEKDKFLVLMRKRAITELEAQKFDLLDDVKTVNIGNDLSVTISIGIGRNGLNYAQNYEYARNAIDLALGRGGDQAVVKSGDEVTYYGGKSQHMEKNTRVKARVKAHALRELLSSKDDKVLVMGHRLPDVDSFGAAVGIVRAAKTMEREVHIVLSDITPSLQPLVDVIQNDESYGDEIIVNNQRALELVGPDTVLVVVDVNKPSITQCPELLKVCKSIVVFDHHRQSTEIIENATLSYIEPYASSACEMVSEILQYIGDNVKMTLGEADCLYSGIMIDTNNFLSKTGVRTFEAAAFLRRSGADVTRVRKLFREDALEYKTRADVVSQAEIYRGSYAISVCKSDEVQSPTIVGAQAANELLNIKGVKASFILTDYQNQIYISARSIDEVNVQIIMEKLGGGGHMTIAGCQLDNSLEEAIGLLKSTIDSMIDAEDIPE